MTTPDFPNVAFPQEAATVLLPGPVGALEVTVEPADASVPTQPIIAVVCHPLSIDGGTKDNKVVTTTARALRELGIATVRFNFRSVGASEGEFDLGVGESDDLRAVVAWVREHNPGTQLWLAGFSFGAYVTFRNAVAVQADALISVAPPVAKRGWDFSAVPLPQVPWLVLMGEADEIVPPQSVFDWIDGLAVQPQLVRFPDTGHFFHRKLIDLRAAIQQQVRAWLPA